MNKRGGLVLRDIIFMLIIFSGIIAMSSILVTQMADTYDNTNMSAEYNQEEIGSDVLSEKSNKWEGIAEDLSGENGIPALVGGGLQALGVILIETIKAPATFSDMVTSGLGLVGASEPFQDIANIILTTLLYALIVFAIAKVFLQGGDI